MDPPPKILVVDDSSIVRRVLSKQLEKIGAEVTDAEDGQQGLNSALSSHFDLIISDIEMPNLDGFSLCEKLKGNASTRRIPIILLSTLDSDRHIDRGFKSGADAYVSKSQARETLPETIERLLQKSRFHRKHQVLVVDDSMSIRHLVSEALEGAGFRVATAKNGKEAMAKIQRRMPDIILSDIEMDEMNGIDLCRKVQSDPALSSIPFVIMSVNSDRAVMRRLMELGAASYLVKPFNLEQVVITVERLLSDHFLILLKERERLDSERKMMLAGITSLIAALEARDPYTKGHSEAVAMFLAEMGARMNVSQEEIDSLGMAGRLHDIGKIGVPDSILLKPGSLTDREYTIIKEHPVIGAAILGPIPSIKPLIPVILHHHERFDGKGYPDGIKGESIPIWARMTAVADTYHALTSDRPYRRGLSQDRAIEILCDVRGTQLCPDCVDTLISVLEDASIPHEELMLQRTMASGRRTLPG
ncbi:MAG: response regulator [Desulfobacteraceae bacterium]|nr:MAG: response regulator [Desulfobacteraceae bacterium]